MIHVVCPNPALDRTVFLKNFIENGVSRANSSLDLLGGKGFNVIRSFFVNEVRPDFCVHTLLGGYIGDYLKTFIENERITSTVTTIKETTRICTILVDEEQNYASLINEPGPSVSEEEISSFVRRLFSQVQSEDIVVFSGSVPGGMDERFYHDMIVLLQNKGAKCILDSSSASLSEGITANPWLIKVNELEFFELLGKEIGQPDAESVERELRNWEGPSNFIVTMGGNGSLAKFDGTVYKVELPSIHATNATASGDIFLGGLTMQISKNCSIEDALLTASTFSLSNCLYWYPNINLSDVEYYKPQIKITNLGG